MPTGPVRQVKRVVRRVVAQRSVNRLVTATLRPLSHSMSPRTLLRIPVTRIVEVEFPWCEGTLRLDAGSDDPIASMLYWHGSTGWEPETMPVFLRLVSPGMTVLDVGANTGLFSLLAARRSASVQVHAIEPVPGVYSMLRANAERNGLPNITCHRLALSDSDGSVTMYVPREKTPVMASLRPGWREDADQITVLTQTLDQLVEELGLTRVDLIKIDTEGTEDSVLKGAARTLQAHRPFIICEVLAGANTATALAEQLLGADYAFFVLAEDGPRPTHRILGQPVVGCHNYLFVPRSRLPDAQRLLALPSH